MTEEQPRSPRSPGEIFLVFTRLALQGFGAVMPVTQHELVERQRWLTKAEFAELLSFGQVVPGPSLMNTSLMIGHRFFGLRGALAALLGMLLLPCVVVLTLAALYGEIAHVPAVAGALRGMGVVSAGLIAGSALKLVPVLGQGPLGRFGSGLVVVAALIAAAWLRVPLAWLIFGLGGASCAAAWWRLGRA